MSPEKILLLQIAAVAGTVLGFLGLVVAAFALRKKRKGDRDFALLAESALALGEEYYVQRFEARVMQGVQDAIVSAAAEAQRRIVELEASLAAVTRERDHWHDAYHGVVTETAIFDGEIDEEDTTVVTSAPRQVN